MTVTRSPDGTWHVVDGDRVLAGPFATDREAWRWVDRHDGEPISPAEKRTEFFVEQMLRSGT